MSHDDSRHEPASVLHPSGGGPVRAPSVEPPRLPRRAVHCALACGTLLLAAVPLTTGDPSAPFAVLYLCIATFAFCFLPRIEAAVHGALVTIAYGAGLLLVPGAHGSSPARFAIFALALAVGGGFIGTLRARHDRLMDKLRTVSRADELTGLLDRRGFDESLASELDRARRSGGRFALIVATVDAFEAIPQPHRSRVLVTTARAIVDAKRTIDTAARLDECEFAVVATYTDERGADVLAERIRGYAADSTNGETALSMGVVSYPRHGATIEILMVAARSARDDAVRLGGDRSLVAVSSADDIAARMHSADVRILPLVTPG
jgi:diguanylate cyclase (GGDEF)-like protein